MDDTTTDSLMSDVSDFGPHCRGVVDDYGNVIAPASATYLHSLSIEILRTWSEFFPIDTDAVNDEETLIRLAYLCFELRRFLENPELFPSDEARARFLAAVSLDPELQFYSACAGLLIKSELDAIRKDTEQDYTRRIYANDINGWENFLLNMAPGGPSDPTDRAHTSPKTSLQLLPPVGMRIISDVEREKREIERYVEIKKDKGYDVTTASTTMMIDFTRKAKATTTPPLMSMPQQTFDATVRQNPFRQTSGSMPEHIVNGLAIEDIGSFIHKLDHPPPPPNHPTLSLHALDFFPQIALRTWCPPARLRNISYLQR